MSNANAYKAEKEAWVSNLNGGSISEINLVTAVTPASIFLWSVVQSRLSLFTPYTPLAALTDFLLNVCTTLYSTTILSSHATLLNLLILIPAALILLTTTRKSRSTSPDKPRKPPPKDAASESLDPLPVKPFITAYRGTMMTITCIAILAVDFPVFPRRFAKAENWGTSLMDLGVGSFVFSAGIIAARPVLKERLQSSSSLATAKTKSLGTRLYTAGRHSLPLLVLGFIRLYSVKGLDYAEHVSEYGVHWNFFFTLGLLPPFVALFDAAFRVVLPSYSILAFLLAAAYQTALATTDLQGYVLTAARTDLLSKNREGVFSLIGYLAIFLAGQGIGTIILPRDNDASASSEWPKKSRQRPQRIWNSIMLRKLAFWGLLWTLLFDLTTSYTHGLNLTVSRRLANLPYVLWIAAFNTIQILLFALIQRTCFPNVHSTNIKDEETRRVNEASSRLLRAFNRNGLVVFLVANLLTGAVNMLLPTLRMGDVAAVVVLVVYMGAVTAVAWGLDVCGVSVKL